MTEFFSIVSTLVIEEDLLGNFAIIFLFLFILGIFLYKELLSIKIKEVELDDKIKKKGDDEQNSASTVVVVVIPVQNTNNNYFFNKK